MKVYLLAPLFLLALIANAQSQYQVSPSSVNWGKYANQPANFDSTGTLNIGGYCTVCSIPMPTQFYTKTITFTTAQVQNMHSVPDTILYSQGPNTIINVVSAYAQINFVGSDSAFVGDTILYLYVRGVIIPAMPTPTIIQVPVASLGELINIPATPLAFPGQFTLLPSSHFIIKSAPLLLNTLTNDLTGGNGNTLTISVTYSVTTIANGKYVSP